jgi:hypothetical protein
MKFSWRKIVPRVLVASLIAIQLVAAASAGAAPSGQRAVPHGSQPVLASLTHDAIRQAVRQALAVDASAAPAPSGNSLRAERYESLARLLAESREPSCLGTDGLSLQPASMTAGNSVYGAGGLVAAPLVLTAKFRGKCR